MKKSGFVQAVDEVQAALLPLLKPMGYRVRGRTFNRLTEDGLTQVINIQMGGFDPPGTTYIPGFRNNMYGKFTVNLGVYVPEVAMNTSSGPAKSWIQEPYCCVRKRLGVLIGEGKDIWWHAQGNERVIEDVQVNLENVGLPFLDRYSTRDRILAMWRDLEKSPDSNGPTRIIMAIIMATRGQRNQARELLRLHHDASLATHPSHAEYVRRLVEKLGLTSLKN